MPDFSKIAQQLSHTPVNPTEEPTEVNINLDEYTPYIGGVGLHTTDDLNLKRAQAQSGLEQTGRTLGNLVPNIALGIVETAGYLGALAAEWNDDRDYTNALTKFAQQNKNPLGETFRETQDTFDLDDPAWWLNNGSGLVESIASFYMVGAGVASIFKAGSKAIINGMKVGAKTLSTASKGLDFASKLGTAGALAYTEGAMVGAEVYKKKYEELISQVGEDGNPLYTPEEVQTAASEAAASTVRINTVINTALNYTSISPLFNKSKNTMQNQFKMLPNEGREAFRKRVGDLTRQDVSKPKWMSYASESLQEGTEELVNQFAERAGMRLGDEYIKGDVSFFDKIAAEFNQLSNFSNDVSNDEGLLSFILGAVGGSGQKVLVSNIKSQKIPELDADGNTILDEKGLPKYKKVTPGKREEIEKDQEFNGFKNNVIADLTFIGQMTDELKKAEEAGEPTDYIKEKLFNIQLYRSLRDGNGDFLKQSLKELGNIDNTTDLGEAFVPQITEIQAALRQATHAKDTVAIQQLTDALKQTRDEQAKVVGKTAAMQQGLADAFETDTDRNDPFYYKNLADRKAKEIDRVNDNYKQLREVFNFAPYDGTQYADNLVWLDANINSLNFTIEHRKSLLTKLKASQTNIGFDQDAWESAIGISQEIKNLQQTALNLVKKQETFEGLSDSNKSKFLITRGIDAETYLDTIEKQVQKYVAQIEATSKNLEETILNHVGDDLDIKAAIKEFQELQALNEAYSEAVAVQEGYIKSLEEENSIDKKLYNKLLDSKGREEFLKNYEKLSEKITKTYEKQVSNNTAKAATANADNKKEDVAQTANIKLSDTLVDDSDEQLLKQMQKFADEFGDIVSPIAPALDNQSSTTDKAKRVIQAIQAFIPISEAFEAKGFATFDAQLEYLYKIAEPKLLEKIFPVFKTIHALIAENGGDVQEATRIRSTELSFPTTDEKEFVERGVLPSEPIVFKTPEKISSDKVLIEEEEMLTEKPITQSGSKINYAPRPYIATGQVKNGKEVFKTVGLNKNPISIALELNTMYPVGTEVSLEIDTKFNGQVRENGQEFLKTFNDFEDANGNLSIDVPIKIVSGGVTLGYLPTQNWINERDAAGNYRNILDEFTVGEEVVTGNVKIQSEQNRIVRQAIIDNFKAGNTSNKVIIGHRGKGVISIAYDENGKRIFDSGTNLLPDPNLQFGISKNGSIYSESGVIADTINNTENLKDGYLYAIVPMGDGSKIALPVQVNKLGAENGAIVTDQIYNYLSNTNTNKVPEFTVGTANGLNRFIRKYFSYITDKNKTMTKTGHITLTAFDSESEGRYMRVALHNLFELNISDTAQLDTEITREFVMEISKYRASKKMPTDKSIESLIGKTLNEVIGEAVANAIFSPQLSLDGAALLNEGTIQPINWINNNIQVEDRVPYNEYVKRFVTTDINGTNSIDDNGKTRYSYVDNTVVNLNLTPLLQAEVKKRASVKLAESSAVPVDAKMQEELKRAEEQWSADVDEKGFPKTSLQEIQDKIRAKYGNTGTKPTGKKVKFTKKGLNEIQDEDSISPSLSQDVNSLVDQAVEDFKNRYLTAKDITTNEQQQVVNTLLFFIRREFDKGNFNVKKAVANAKDAFETSVEIYEIRSEGDELDGDEYEQYNQIPVAKAKQLLEAFKTVLEDNNWKFFVEGTLKKLSKIGYNIKDNNAQSVRKSLSEIVEGLETEYAGEEGKALERFDELSFELDPRNTASSRIKLFLSTIKKPDGSSFLGTDIYYEYQDLYMDILRTVAGTNPSLKEIKGRLLIEGKDYAGNLVAKLNAAPLHIQNEFVKVVTMQNQSFKTVLFNVTPTGTTIKVINSNQTKALDVVKEAWGENFKNFGASRYDDKGNIEYDKAKINALWEQIDKVQPSLASIVNWMEAIGIDYNESYINSLLKSLPKSYPKGITSSVNKNGIFYLINESIKESASYEISNIFVDEVRSLNVIANTYLKFNPIYYTDNHVSVEGKTIHDYGLNNRLSDMMRDLKDERVQIRKGNLPFSKRSWLLTEFEKRADEIELVYIDGLKKQYSSLDGKTYADMSERERELFILGMFQNQNQRNGFFLNPPHSDKPTRTAIRHNKVSIVGLTADMELPNAVKDRLNKNIQSELDYILTSQRDIVDVESPVYKMKSLFYFFPNLNYHNLSKKLSKEELAIIYVGANPEGYGILNDSTNPLFREILLREAESYIKQLITDRIDYWKSIEFNYWDSIYIEGKVDAIPNELYAAADLEINYFLHNFDYYQLFGGHPSNNAKYVPNDIEGSFSNTVIDVLKRGAKELAPGYELQISKLNKETGEFEESKSINLVVTKDVKTSPISKYIEANPIFKDAYKKTNLADAQGFASLEEFLALSLGEGKITEETYKELLRKEEAEILDVKDLTAIFQPKKPVIVSDLQTDTDDVPFYVKYSVIPLIKQYTKNTELEYVRQQMKADGIDLLVFESAVKIGKQNVKMATLDNIGADNIVNISRAGFKIQQEVPFKDKTKILTVSQMNKLITEGILNVEGFKYKDGTFTGNEIRNEKDRIRKTLFDIGKKKLYRRLGVELVEGVPVFQNLEKLSEALKRQAIEQGYSPNDVAQLEVITNASGEQIFSWPLFFNNSGQRFESVINALISNDVIRQKLPGNADVQVSDVGRKRISSTIPDGVIYADGYNKDELSFVDVVNGEVQFAEVLVPWRFKDDNGVTLNINKFTKTVDGKTVIDMDKIPKELLELVGARIPNQGHNSMLPIRIVGFLPEGMTDTIVVPKGITTQMGSDFDVDKLYSYMRNYVYQTGTLKVITPDYLKSQEDKKAYLVKLKKLAMDSEAAGLTFEELDERLQDLINYLNSVIGFNGNITLFLQNTIDANVVDDAFFDELGDEKIAQNEYIDLHLSVLTNPVIIDKIIQPLDLPDLADEKKLFESLGLSEIKLESLASLRFNEASYEENRAAKLLTGTQSVASTFNAITQGSELMLGNDGKIFNLNVRTNDGETLSLNRIDQEGVTYNGKKEKKNRRTKNQNISATQSAAVDNAKDKLLDIFNFNNETINAVNALLLLNTKSGKILDLTSITRMVAQPIIIEYVKTLKLTNDSLDSTFTRDREKAVTDKLIKKYTKLMTSKKRSKMVDENIYLLSPKLLLQRLEESLDDVKSADYYEDQLRTLMFFNQAKGIGQLILGAQTAINTDSKGLPPSMLELNNKVQKIETLQSQISNDGVYLMGLNSLYEREGSGQTEVGYLSDFVKDMNNLLFPLFPYDKLQSIFDIATPLTNKVELSNKDKKQITNSFRAFVLSKLIDNQYDVRKDFVVKQEGKNTLAEDVLVAQKTTWGKQNPFLQRLKTFIPPSDAETNYIYYINSKADELSDDTISLGFADVYTHDKVLFEKLVEYSLAIGGLQDINSFSQFIPFDYLKAINFPLKLRTNINNFDAYEEFVQEFFQHYPEKLRQVKTKGNAFVLPKINPEDKKAPFSNIWTIQKTPNGSIFVYPELVGRRDGGKFKIFKKISVDENGDTSYMEIDVLGNRYMYEFGAVTSLVNSNRVAIETEEEESEPTESKPQQGTQEEGLSTVNPILESRGYEASENGKAVITNVLNNIKNSDSNFASLAGMLQKVIANSNYVFETRTNSDTSLPAYVQGHSSHIEAFNINPLKIKTIGFFDSMLVHESIHLATINLIKRWKVNPNSVPKEQADVIHKLNVLRNRIIEKVATNKHDGQNLVNSFRYVYEQFKNNRVIDESITFEEWLDTIDSNTKQFANEAVSTNAAFYGLISLEEFVTNALTNKDFMNFLNKVNLGEASAFDKFVSFITELLTELSKFVGVKIADKSALKEVIINTLELIDSNETVSPYVMTSTIGKTKYKFNLASDGTILGATEGRKKLSLEDAQRIYRQAILDGNLTVTLTDAENSKPKRVVQEVVKPKVSLADTMMDEDVVTTPTETPTNVPPSSPSKSLLFDSWTGEDGQTAPAISDDWTQVDNSSPIPFCIL